MMTAFNYLITDTLAKLTEDALFQNDSVANRILENQHDIAYQLNELAKNDNTVLFLFLGALLGLILTLLWTKLMTVKKNWHYREKLKK